MAIPAEDVTPRQRAEAAARASKPDLATAWALISIANDLAEIRRDLHWSVRSGGGAKRG